MFSMLKFGFNGRIPSQKRQILSAFFFLGLDFFKVEILQICWIYYTKQRQKDHVIIRLDVFSTYKTSKYIKGFYKYGPEVCCIRMCDTDVPGPRWQPRRPAYPIACAGPGPKPRSRTPSCHIRQVKCSIFWATDRNIFYEYNFQPKKKNLSLSPKCGKGKLIKMRGNVTLLLEYAEPFD